MQTFANTGIPRLIVMQTEILRKKKIQTNMNKINIEPTQDRIVIEADPIKEEIELGGTKLLLAETAKEKPQIGTVMAVGPGNDGFSVSLKPGDRVMYGKNSGVPIEVDGKNYLLMREFDVIGVLTNEQ